MSIVSNGMFESWEVDAVLGGYNPEGWTKDVPTQNGELVTEGDFPEDLAEWTAAAGWSWDAGEEPHVGIAVHADDEEDVTPLEQDIAVVDTLRYKVVLSVVGMTAGSLTVDLEDSGSDPLVIEADGDYDVEFVAGATGDKALSFTPTADFDGAVDDISAVMIGTDILQNQTREEQPGDFPIISSAEFKIDDEPSEATLAIAALTLALGLKYKLSFSHKMLHGGLTGNPVFTLKVTSQNYWLDENGEWQGTEQLIPFYPLAQGDVFKIRFSPKTTYTSYDLAILSNDLVGEEVGGVLEHCRFVVSNAQINPVVEDDISLNPENNDTAFAALPQNSFSSF